MMLCYFSLNIKQYLRTITMKYTVQRLDKRFNYFEWFKYHISFSARITVSQGPLHFIESQQWFTNTYGFSAEIRIWQEIKTHYAMRNQFNLTSGPGDFSDNLPFAVNPHWSWSNAYRDLRIYIADDQELSLFKLAIG